MTASNTPRMRSMPGWKPIFQERVGLDLTRPTEFYATITF